MQTTVSACRSSGVVFKEVTGVIICCAVVLRRVVGVREESKEKRDCRHSDKTYKKRRRLWTCSVWRTSVVVRYDVYIETVRPAGQFRSPSRRTRRSDCATIIGQSLSLGIDSSVREAVKSRKV